MSVMNEEAEGQTLAWDYTAHQWQGPDGNHPQTLETVRVRSTQRHVLCRNSQQSISYIWGGEQFRLGVQVTHSDFL